MTDTNTEETEKTAPTLEFSEYVRKPFIVEAVKVTLENLEAIAAYVGDVDEKEDGTKFIKVNKNLVPNVWRVYPGFYMTRMGDNIRCYSPKIFAEQFTDLTPDIKEWVDFITSP